MQPSTLTNGDEMSTVKRIGKGTVNLGYSLAGNDEYVRAQDAPPPAPVFTAPKTNTAINKQRSVRDTIETLPASSVGDRRGAILAGGDSGLQIDPLGRRGLGGIGRTSLLGR